MVDFRSLLNNHEYRIQNEHGKSGEKISQQALGFNRLCGIKWTIIERIFYTVNDTAISAMLEALDSD